MKIQYAMVFVSDMDASVAFYRDVLGIPLKFQSPHWTEFVTEGATLALHPTPTAPLEALQGGGKSPAGTMRLGFNVEDIDAFHSRMLANDVPCLQEPTLQFGAKLAQYGGPDGLVFSIGETRVE